MAPRNGESTSFSKTILIRPACEIVPFCWSNSFRESNARLLSEVTGLLPRSARRKKEREKSPRFAGGVCTPRIWDNYICTGPMCDSDTSEKTEISLRAAERTGILIPGRVIARFTRIVNRIKD